MNAFAPKRVLVSGARGALGSAVVRKYLQMGFQVVGMISHFEKPKEESKRLLVDAALSWIQTDITDSKSVRSSLKGEHFDIFVHCAGGFRFGTLEELKDEDLDFLINTNLKSAFYLVRELIPYMKSHNFGRIVFVSTKGTLLPSQGMAAYTASKAGLNLLTACLAEETKKFNITVNSVLPTVSDTPSNREAMADAKFDDWVTPSDLAEIIFSLTSELGKPIHGSLIPVSGRL